MAERAVGVMGGTFDPIHYGHLVAASEVAHLFGLDEVVFVPTGRPWQKRKPTGAEHRHLMAVIATAEDQRFTVSRVDIERDGATYTVDTLSDLQEHLGGAARMYFITGADALSSVLTWRDPQRILQLAHLIGVSRPEHEISLRGLPPGRVSVVEVPALAISSTDIRQRVSDGRPIRYLLPAGVESYVRKHGLYRGSDH